MFNDMKADEQAYLIRDLGDDLRRRHHIRRLFISVFLCLGPLLDALLLWWIVYPDVLKSSSRLFKYFSGSYTAINVSTSLIGFWGMLFENEAASRSSLALIVIQNTLMLIFTSLVLICMLFRLDVFALHHAPLFLQYLEKNRKLGILCCILAIIIRTSCYFMVWSIGELEASYDKSRLIAFKHHAFVGGAAVDDTFHIDIISEADEP